MSKKFDLGNLIKSKKIAKKEQKYRLKIRKYIIFYRPSFIIPSSTNFIQYDLIET